MPSHRPPNPWALLHTCPDLNLVRAPIPEPGRYYHAHRTIILRKGLLLVEERRYLWHELVHALRGDEACHISESAERSVEREAARRAMPLDALCWAGSRAHDWHTLADALKLPEPWVRWRVDLAFVGGEVELSHAH